ncbi:MULTISPECIES: GHKL domain-containing protein [unclassified Enterococcus]|jgi:two-component system sensor histidine kinase AgrC|uniref:GHKL domain-containing protein n=1 Tax=unclassified Enterococcus TaxID=2608891 RepID=UPI003D296A01
MRYHVILAIVFLTHAYFNLYIGARVLTTKYKAACLLMILSIFSLVVSFPAIEFYLLPSVYFFNFLILYAATRNYLFTIVYILSEYFIIQMGLVGSGSVYFAINDVHFTQIDLFTFSMILAGMSILFFIGIKVLNWAYQKFEVYVFLYKMSNSNKRAMAICLSIFAVFAYYQRICVDFTKSDYWLVTAILFLMAILLFGGLYLVIKASIYYENLYNTVALYDEKLEKMSDLKSFRHDYEGILLSLTTVLEEGDTRAALDQLHKIKEYSEEVIDSKSYLEELELIKCLPLKSILYLEINKAKTAGIKIDIRFDQEVSEVSMNMFDLIRCLTILLNNAIEASLETKKPYISVRIREQNGELQITIQNNYSTRLPLHSIENKGASSKQGHSGLGLQNLKKITSMYNNVQYTISRNEQFFEVVLSLKKI